MTDHNYPEKKFNPSIILLMFVLTWTFDSFAYLIGKKFGKTKILPNISPKSPGKDLLVVYSLALLQAVYCTLPSANI